VARRSGRWLARAWIAALTSSGRVPTAAGPMRTGRPDTAARAASPEVAIVSFMIYAFVAPGLLAFLAFNQRWFYDARPWVDAKYNQDALRRGDGLTGEAWKQLSVTSLVWVVLPAIIGTFRLLRAEVK
jgi:hypothetical protein